MHKTYQLQSKSNIFNKYGCIGTVMEYDIKKVKEYQMKYFKIKTISFIRFEDDKIVLSKYR